MTMITRMMMMMFSNLEIQDIASTAQQNLLIAKESQLTSIKLL